MEKSKFYLLIIIGLLISNCMLVGFLFLRNDGGAGKPPHPGSPMQRGPRNLIIDRLKFDKEQVFRYDKLIAWHRREIDKADQRIVDLKNTLYLGLTETIDSTRVDSLISEMTATRKQIEEVHYKHFMDIRGLCKPEQLPEFNELTRDMASLFAPHGEGKPPHR